MATRKPTQLENWQPIPGYPHYQVSDKGRVKSLDRTVTGKNGTPRKVPGRVLKPWRSGVDRFCVKLSHDGQSINARVHQLVALTFLGECPENMMVCHNDGNHDNNRADNLRYDTMSSNMLDAVHHGTHNMARKTHCNRGHELVEPNLAIAAKRKGWRECKACSKSRPKAKNEEDLQKLSDAYYQQLMGASRKKAA